MNNETLAEFKARADRIEKRAFRQFLILILVSFLAVAIPVYCSG